MPMEDYKFAFLNYILKKKRNKFYIKIKRACHMYFALNVKRSARGQRCPLSWGSMIPFLITSLLLKLSTLFVILDFIEI